MNGQMYGCNWKRIKHECNWKEWMTLNYELCVCMKEVWVMDFTI